jgi:hypothetical protein
LPSGFQACFPRIDQDWSNRFHFLNSRNVAMDQDACDFLVLIATKLHELAKAESSPKKIYSPAVQVATKTNFKHILLGKL